MGLRIQIACPDLGAPSLRCELDRRLVRVCYNQPSRGGFCRPRLEPRCAKDQRVMVERERRPTDDLRHRGPSGRHTVGPP